MAPDTTPDSTPEPSRRRFLTVLAGLGGLGAVALTTKSSLTHDIPHQASGLTGGMSLTELSRGSTSRAIIHQEQVWSAARGRTVGLVTLIPAGSHHGRLPVCVVLHGRTGHSEEVTAAPMPRTLDDTITRGGTPFAVMAVDGGDDYWHEHNKGDDPMGMLLREVPMWAAARGLGAPEAAVGVSMGGFGALLYARRRREQGRPLRAVGAIAPALILSWEEMSKRNAFHDEADWASMDPLRNIPALGNVPVGIWCGTEDSFIEGARQFIDKANPEVATLGPGGHTRAFFDESVPPALAFVGSRLR
ncbi:alpha/beta hydrolase [Actinoalloteichus hymeniacidonis]|uniref:Acyl-CoA:diacylglycerol acyltransferase n=1 Tax=Actinoalloteichus hymeniacidonis TaxID=340345 RepID=A0AAC9MXK7_9PSEU|nr:alpha/beta hydrolase-fold protein [Actinoalloteichus hymeniacidonis]AOS62429.1 putative esterase [Actinoalloteichus hymeniacidonis]MBB5909540.1 S-formylglutathione hydrolase FrmB [Actinoalloteichus hymeniacidonis]